MDTDERKDISTENKIREAAYKIFQQKGYAGTRTRDIAEEAGINLALLNYYYRSKEKLFEIIMEESLKRLFASIQSILNDNSTTLSQKIDIIVNLYIDLLKENPNIPLFILSEMQANPELFKEKIGARDFTVHEIWIVNQINKQMQDANLQKFNPIHIIINIVSLTIFPFAAKPLIKIFSNSDENSFNQFIEERRVLIPFWIKAMLKIEN